MRDLRCREIPTGGLVHAVGCRCTGDPKGSGPDRWAGNHPPPATEKRKVVYIAHPLRGKTPEETTRNRKRASELVAQIAAERNIAPVASWIILSEHWSEETGRALGLKIDCALIEVCEELWIIGPVRELAEGMRIEVAHAKENGVFVVNLQGVYE